MSAADAAIARNREAKARVLARSILKQVVYVAGEMTEEQWAELAEKAGINKPSALTVTETIRILSEIPL